MSLQDQIFANRLAIFRHSFRNLAMASAAASGVSIAALSGCASSHDASPDMYVRADMSAPDQSLPDQGPEVWWPTCLDDGSVELSTDPLAPGIDGAQILAWADDWQTFPRVAFTLGDFCGPVAIDACRMETQTAFWGGTALPAALVRRGSTFETVTIDAALRAGVDTPELAAIHALVGTSYLVSCDVPGMGAPTGVRPTDDGYVVEGLAQRCIDGLYRGVVRVAPDGQTTIMSETRAGDWLNCAAVGRLTAGTNAPRRPEHGDEVGRYFAQVAGLEAAAVHAFERLANELTSHGAPEHLVALSRRSADDERRHTHSMAALARRYGVGPSTSETVPGAPRPLFAITLENAVEGCVRETYGAVVAHHQAQTARDPVVAAAMHQVAEDETRHAALSWSIAEWALPKLTADEQRRVRQAQRAAIAELREHTKRPEPAALVEQAGLPSVEAAAHILGGLTEGVWA